MGEVSHFWNFKLCCTCTVNLDLVYDRCPTIADLLRSTCTLWWSNECWRHYELHSLQYRCTSPSGWTPCNAVLMYVESTLTSTFCSSNAVALRFTTKILGLKYVQWVLYVFWDNPKILHTSLQGERGWDALHRWKLFPTLVRISAFSSGGDVVHCHSLPSRKTETKPEPKSKLRIWGPCP